MNAPEIWMDIPGYNGKYRISSMGHASFRKHNGEYQGLKLNRCTAYLSFGAVDKHGGQPKQKTFYVHRIVAEVFHGKRPDGMVIRHIDGNRYNNFAENLKYGWPEENVSDAIKHEVNKGVKNGRHKLDDRDVEIIKNLFKENVPLSVIARSFGVSVPAINFIHKNKHWVHI